jgi:GT2 family glycosyltransferase
MPRIPSEPELSVIIPVRDGERALPPLLESLRAQTLAPERFEVIVVDNASRDRTAEIAAASGARVVNEPIPNRSRARNAGAAAARAQLYAFTDADCVADAQWLGSLLGARGRAPLVAGDVRLTVSERPNVVERYEALWRFGQEAWVREQGWAATANLLVSAEAFAAVGGFDTTWRHIGEDVDFCFRAAKAGYGLAYCAEAIVSHDGERAWRPLLERCFRHGYSVNQAYHRLAAGGRAWRNPRPLVGDRALRESGHSPERFSPREWRAMARVARVAYVARMTGSLWSELSRAR